MEKTRLAIPLLESLYHRLAGIHSTNGQLLSVATHHSIARRVVFAMAWCAVISTVWLFVGNPIESLMLPLFVLALLGLKRALQ
jgi:hypothetical protein